MSTQLLRNHVYRIELLVNGFISDIETQFSGDIIIPTSIIKLCFEFYKYDQQIIYHVLQLRDSARNDGKALDISFKQIFISTLPGTNNIAKPEYWATTIHPINKSESKHKSMTKNGGITIQKNIDLPSSLTDKLSLRYNELSPDQKCSDSFDAVFISGGRQGCCAIFFDQAQFANNPLEIIGISMKLPIHTITLSDATYSAHHGLIAMGSPPSRNPAQLFLNNYADKDWNWNYLSSPYDGKRNGWTSIISIQVDDNKERLMCLGTAYLNKVKMYLGYNEIDND